MLLTAQLGLGILADSISGCSTVCVSNQYTGVHQNTGRAKRVERGARERSSPIAPPPTGGGAGGAAGGNETTSMRFR